jgi:hypothetical protein
MYKVAVITPWRYRNHFVEAYNNIWSDQSYNSYDVHIFEEEYTLKQKLTQFNENFFVHAIETNSRLSIGEKLNYAFEKIINKYDYIMLSSSDDYYSPNYIETCISFMLEYNLDVINMMEANYINLKTMSLAKVNTCESYSGMFFLKSSLAQKYKWNETLRAGEDRFMLNLWKKSGAKHISTNIHQQHWLGIIHPPIGAEAIGNWNTNGDGWTWKNIDRIWLESYLNNNFLFNFYTTLCQL